MKNNKQVEPLKEYVDIKNDFKNQFQKKKQTQKEAKDRRKFRS